MLLIYSPILIAVILFWVLRNINIYPFTILTPYIYLLYMQALDDYMLPCLNKKLLGIECMGCGLQRSIALIFKGEFVDAFYMYPAVYGLIILFLYIGANIFFKFKHANKIISTLAIITVATIIINYIIKIIN